MEKTLYILRHAKAETGSSTQDDHGRALNEQGLEACKIMGKYLTTHAITPQMVLCSTAKRAKDTWELVKKTFKHSVSTEYTDRLYLASANEILGQLTLLPDDIASVMIVGHNPGLHQLCLNLAHRGDEALLDKLALKFPTCALAAIELDSAWKDAARANAKLAMFVSPKML